MARLHSARGIGTHMAAVGSGDNPMRGSLPLFLLLALVLTACGGGVDGRLAGARTLEVHDLLVDAVRQELGEPAVLEVELNGSSCAGLSGPTGKVELQAQAAWEVDGLPAEAVDDALDLLEELMAGLEDVDRVLPEEGSSTPERRFIAQSKLYQIRVVGPFGGDIVPMLGVFAESPCADPVDMRDLVR